MVRGSRYLETGHHATRQGVPGGVPRDPFGRVPEEVSDLRQSLSEIGAASSYANGIRDTERIARARRLATERVSRIEIYRSRVLICVAWVRLLTFAQGPGHCGTALLEMRLTGFRIPRLSSLEQSCDRYLCLRYIGCFIICGNCFHVGQ